MLRRNENGIARTQPHALFADLEFVFAFEDVNPFVLTHMRMQRAAAVAVEFENAHRAVRVVRGDFAVERFGTEMNARGGASISCRDP